MSSNNLCLTLKIGTFYSARKFLVKMCKDTILLLICNILLGWKSNRQRISERGIKYTLNLNLTIPCKSI